MAKPEKKELARKLREQGWSVRAIEKELNVSKSSVSRWTKDIVLTEAQESALQENRRRVAQRRGTQANVEKNLALRQSYQDTGREIARQKRRLHLIGCMLYWAEGAKDRNRIDFVNSDANMMKLFVDFLKQELDVPAEEILVRIHCHTHEENEIARIENYWLELLKLPQSCLRKTQIKVGSNSRKNRLLNGVCGVRVQRTELVQHIYGAIQEYGGFENPDWLL